VTGAKPFGFQRVMGLDPVEWVLSMMADPDRWRREPGLIRVTHVGLREAAKLPADKDRYSWDELTKHPGLAAAMEKVHEKVRADREAKLDPIEREVSGLEDTLGILDSVFTLSGIRVVPHPTDPRGTWFSLRDLDDADAAPIMTIRTLRDALLRFAKDGDREHLGPAASALSKRLASMAPDTYPVAKDLRREVHYNTFKPFRLAWLLYLVGFFSLLAYTPFPLDAAAKAAGLTTFGAHQLGLIFCGWGICLAITSVFAAPRLTRRFGRQRVLYAMLLLLAVDLAVMAVQVHNLTALIVGTIVGGLFLGVMNTVLTESVMDATDLPRSVASSTYSGVRFVGGSIAPALAGIIAAALGSGAPYWVGCAGLLVAVGILFAGRRHLAPIDTHLVEESYDEAMALTAADS